MPTSPASNLAAAVTARRGMLVADMKSPQTLRQ
jgi:hypothetical protein